MEQLDYESQQLRDKVQQFQEQIKEMQVQSRKDSSEMNKEIASLKNSLRNAEEHNLDLEAKNREIRDLFEKASAKQTELNEDLQMTKRQVAMKDEKISNLEKENLELRSSVNTSEAKLTKVLSETTDFEQERSELKKQIEVLNKTAREDLLAIKRLEREIVHEKNRAEVVQEKLKNSQENLEKERTLARQNLEKVSQNLSIERASTEENINAKLKAEEALAQLRSEFERECRLRKEAENNYEEIQVENDHLKVILQSSDKERQNFANQIKENNEAQQKSLKTLQLLVEERNQLLVDMRKVTGQNKILQQENENLKSQYEDENGRANELESKIQSFEQNVKQMEKTIDSQSFRAEQLVSRISDLEKAESSLQVTVTKLRKENVDNLCRIEDLIGDQTSLKTSKDVLQRDLEKTKQTFALQGSELQSAKAQIIELEAHIQEKQDEVVHTVEEKQRLEKEIAQLKTELEKNSITFQEHATMEKNLKNQLTAAKQRELSLTNQKETLDAQKGTANQSVIELKEEIKKIRIENKNLKYYLDKTKLDFNEMKLNFETEQSSHKIAAESLAKSYRKEKKLKEENEILILENTEEKARITEHLREISNLKKQNESLINECETLQKSNFDFEREVAELKQSLSRANELVEREKNSLERSLKIYQDEQREKERSLKQQSTDLQKTNQVLQTQVGRIDEQFRQMRSKLNDAEQETSQLKSTVQRYENEITRHTDKIARLTKKNQSLAKENIDIKQNHELELKKMKIESDSAYTQLIAQHHATKEALGEKISVLEKTIEKLEFEKREITEHLNQTNERLTEVFASLSTSVKQSEDIKTTNEDLLFKKTNLDEDLQASLRKSEALERKLQKTEKESKEKIQELLLVLGELKKENFLLKRDIEFVQKLSRQIRGCISPVIEEVDFKIHLEKILEEVKALAKGNQELHFELHKKQKDLHNLQDSFDHQEKHFSTVNDENDVLNQEIQVLRSDRAKHEKEKEKLTEGIEALRRALQMTKDTLQEMEKEKQTLKQENLNFRQLIKKIRQTNRIVAPELN